MGEIVTHLYKGHEKDGVDFAVCGKGLNIKEKFTNDLLECTCRVCVIKEGKSLFIKQRRLFTKILKQVGATDEEAKERSEEYEEKFGLGRSQKEERQEEPTQAQLEFSR